MASLERQIRQLVARLIDGVGTVTAIILFLALAAVLAYGIAGSCTGQFDQRDDLKDLLQASTKSTES